MKWPFLNLQWILIVPKTAILFVNKIIHLNMSLVAKDDFSVKEGSTSNCAIVQSENTIYGHLTSVLELKQFCKDVTSSPESKCAKLWSMKDPILMLAEKFISVDSRVHSHERRLCFHWRVYIVHVQTWFDIRQNQLSQTFRSNVELFSRRDDYTHCTLHVMRTSDPI